jgi:hypothetical protein
MTTTDDILAMAAHAVPPEDSVQAAEDLIGFAEAVTHGMNTDVVRTLRALRPGSLPDSPAWRAWLSATAAMAAVTAAADAAGVLAAGPPAPANPAVPIDPARPAPRATSADPAIRFAVCAAATALGDDCSAAVAAGTQAAALIQARLAEIGAEQTGWSAPAVSAVIGAGLAAGMMLGLPEHQLRHALGICATQAAGLRAAAGTHARPLQAGKAAFNAVEAAQLASLGFTSSREPLDGRRGLFTLFGTPAA